MTAAGLRVSDAERDAVAAELAEHLKDGRLDTAEFDERMGRAMSARTRGDLDGLLADLPRQTSDQPPAPRRAGWPFRLVPVAIIVLFVAIAGAAGHAGGHPHPVWGLWWLLWLIPIAVFTARRWHRGYAPRAGR